MKKTLSKSIFAILIIVSLNSCKKDNSYIPIATSISLLSEESMEGIAGQQLIDSVAVLVKDQFDQPIKDVILNCIITEGALTNKNPITNVDGIVSFYWKLGPSEYQRLIINLPNTSGDIKTKFQIKINATAELPIVTDVDGNVYNTVRIGRQVWMKENLRTTKYSNGLPISLVENTEAWASLSNTDKAYCFYNNDENNGVNYGLLYTWAAATNGEGYSALNPSGIQGICPNGWHIPSSAEWIQLYEYLGGSDIAGGKMKELGLDHWLYPNDGASNSSGFTALPSGYRMMTGDFYGLGQFAYFWCTTENCLPCGPASWWLYSNVPDFYHGGSSYFNSGYSVRCIMDYN